MKTSRSYNLETLISFRHDLHKHAELAFQEVRTSSKIIEYLLKIGIKEDNIKKIAKTGLIVDISGTAPPSGKPFCIALRADMDGLPIKEENPDIDYQSVTNAAHMCGHDMHVTCLLGGASLLLEKLDQIPSDKTIRLLFQPAEEGDGGAIPMIKEGAMDGVDEVYGFHNGPFDKPGKLYVKKGPMMASIININVVITGKGGHSSASFQLKDPLQPAVDIHVGLRGLIKEYQDKGEKFTVSLPYLKTGDATNAISDTCEIKGHLRTFDDNFTEEFKSRFEDLVNRVCSQYGCTANTEVIEVYAVVSNSEKETEHVIRVGKKVFGDENVGGDDIFPLFASEDFSFFLKERPGAFFFLSSARKEGDMPHTNNFNPNDDMIPSACEMWLRLVEDRFEISSL